MLTLKKVLKSSLTINIFSSILAIFLAGFFWIDLSGQGASDNLLTRVSVLIIGAVSIYLIWTRLFPTLPILYMTFAGCYFLYQLLFSRSWPIYFIMILLFLILWMVFPIFHIKNNHGIYFFLLVLSLFEVFLVLSYWLVNPISRSLIMAITAYLFGGWLISLDQKSTKGLANYFVFAGLAFAIILLTTRWGI